MDFSGEYLIRAETLAPRSCERTVTRKLENKANILKSKTSAAPNGTLLVSNCTSIPPAGMPARRQFPSPVTQPLTTQACITIYGLRSFHSRTGFPARSYTCLHLPVVALAAAL